MTAPPSTPGAYTGRFAPSPTGPLHFGSLTAAVGSFLQARACDGHWLVRIEDLDPPREVAGSADLILKTLEAFSLEWDGPVLYQSTRHAAYEAAVSRLINDGQAYLCACSRKWIQSCPGGIHPENCRVRPESGQPCAVRIRAPGQPAAFDDLLQGRVTLAPAGDFVIRRRDGLYAYQLAVTVDDTWQGVTEVVRGYDLLDSTPRQIHLRRLLQLPAVRYAHLPVVLDGQGEKLAKSTGAAALCPADLRADLHRVLQVLGQQPPDELLQLDPPEQLDWAIKNWNMNNLQGIAAVKLNSNKTIAKRVDRQDPTLCQAPK